MVHLLYTLSKIVPSLRKQPTFHEVTTWALTKRCLSNERRNSIFMTFTTQSLVVNLISMEFLCSLPRCCFARAQVATSWNVSCFLRLSCTPPYTSRVSQNNGISCIATFFLGFQSFWFSCLLGASFLCRVLHSHFCQNLTPFDILCFQFCDPFMTLKWQFSLPFSILQAKKGTPFGWSLPV